MMKRKIATLILAFLVVFSTAACSKTGDGASKNATKTEEKAAADKDKGQSDSQTSDKESAKTDESKNSSEKPEERKPFHMPMGEEPKETTLPIGKATIYSASETNVDSLKTDNCESSLKFYQLMRLHLTDEQAKNINIDKGEKSCMLIYLTVKNLNKDKNISVDFTNSELEFDDGLKVKPYTKQADKLDGVLKPDESFEGIIPYYFDEEPKDFKSFKIISPAPKDESGKVLGDDVILNVNMSAK